MIEIIGQLEGRLHGPGSRIAPPSTMLSLVTTKARTMCAGCDEYRSGCATVVEVSDNSLGTSIVFSAAFTQSSFCSMAAHNMVNHPAIDQSRLPLETITEGRSIAPSRELDCKSEGIFHAPTQRTRKRTRGEYPCKVCSKSYTENRSLLRHLRTSTKMMDAKWTPTQNGIMDMQDFDFGDLMGTVEHSVDGAEAALTGLNLFSYGLDGVAGDCFDAIAYPKSGHLGADDLVSGFVTLPLDGYQYVPDFDLNV